jgi:large subunit ribosomal protein L13
MPTVSAKSSDTQREWFVVDAAGQPLGRLASRIAAVLRGKHRPSFTRHADVGDFVVVINAEKVALSGAKLTQKMFPIHSGYPGGLRLESYANVLARKPTHAIDRAVRGMLPKTTLGRAMRKKLKVYAGGTHPHAAQKPQPFPY